MLFCFRLPKIEKKMRLTITTCFALLICFTGCSKPPAPWTPPSIALHHATEMEGLEVTNYDEIAHDFYMPIGYATYDGRPYDDLVDEVHVGPGAEWITYQIPMELVLADKHALLVIAQDLQGLTNTGLERIGREPNSIRIDICDRNFNWIAGTNDKGEIVVKQ